MTPPPLATDRECLEAFARSRDVESLRPVLARYLNFVHASALRRANDPVRAAEITRAVFLVLIRRARRLRKKTVLADWLFQVTCVTARRAGVKPRRVWWRFWNHSGSLVQQEMDARARFATELDGALEKLSSSKRRVVLLVSMLCWPVSLAASMLGTTEASVQKRGRAALQELARKLARKIAPMEPDFVGTLLAMDGCSSWRVSDELPGEVFAALTANGPRRPKDKLARRTLNTLAWARWRRRVAVAVPVFFLTVALLGFIGFKISQRDGHSRFFATAITWSVKNEARSTPGMIAEARSWPTNTTATQETVRRIQSAVDLYQTTNIWPVHLQFTREQWTALEPRRIGVLPHIFQPDGTVQLRHPDAQRSGLAGVLGYDFDWSRGQFEFDGQRFTNVAVRVKGNGTYLGALATGKRSLKVDLNKFADGQKLGGADEFNFHNLVNDFSCMSDALSCEFFREAGVPAPRTAYAWLTIGVEEKWERKPFGLFAMIEPVDGDFARRWFGSKKAPVFKPVTYELFQDRGEAWTNYAAIYDLKTQATPAQQRRVIDLARLVSHAEDAEFAARIGDYLDLEAFARFLAGQVLLSNYDSFLANGQNFYVYLDPRTDKFGFIPWDMDLSWGSFFLLGTTEQRERASIWHPWVGKNLFLERVLKVEAFRELYRARLEDFYARLFVPEKISARIDELAAVLREPVAAESAFRLRKFEESFSTNRVEQAGRKRGDGANRAAHQLKVFLQKRAESVRAQLDGKSKGVILQRGR